MFLRFFAILFFSAPFFLFSQGIKFYEGSFDNLKAEAKKQNKLIFIDCYTTWCGPCKWMSKNVFPDSLVGVFYNSNFINYKMDMEKGEGKEVRTLYTVNVFPTYLFINSDGEIENRSIGACDTAEFINIGKKTLDRENNYGALLRKYNSGDRTPDFLASYALACANVYLPYDINEYFATQKNSELLSETNFILIEWYLTDIKSREFKYLIENREKYAELLGKERVEGRIVEIFKKNALLIPTDKKAKPMDLSVFEMISEFNLPDSIALKYKILLQYYSKGKNRDWKEYSKYSLNYIDKIGIENIPVSELFEIVQNLTKNSQDQEILQKTITWTDTLILKEYKIVDSYFLKAKLYKNMGEPVKSLQYANMALAEEKKKSNPNSAEIENFILEISNDIQKK